VQNFKFLGTIASLIVGAMCLLVSNLILMQIHSEVAATKFQAAGRYRNRGSWAEQYRLLLSHREHLPNSPLRKLYVGLTAAGMTSWAIFLSAMIGAQILP
jgi:hypothetical protein